MNKKANFTININNSQEMVTARETLRALGYKIYAPFDDSTFWSDGYVALLFDGADIRRACKPTCMSPISPSISALGTSYASLQSFLNDYFAIETEDQKKVRELKEKIEILQEELAALEAK